MADAVSGVTSSNPWYTPPTGPAATPGVVDKNMFLKLLVAQMRNQDPMKPNDGTEFVGQLAQFQQLEQAVNTGGDIEAIRKDLAVLAGTKEKS
jgi:flagellar basal-body rod modification protein FlgD